MALIDPSPFKHLSQVILTMEGFEYLYVFFYASFGILNYGQRHKKASVKVWEDLVHFQYFS